MGDHQEISMGGSCSAEDRKQVDANTKKIEELQIQIAALQKFTELRAVVHASEQNAASRQSLQTDFSADENAAKKMEEEYAKAAEEKHKERQAKAGLIFKAADADENGELSIEEIAKYVSDNADAKELLGEKGCTAMLGRKEKFTKEQFEDFYIANCGY